jgi:uncharacterized membrane protein HdeD (DUF308 family)
MHFHLTQQQRVVAIAAGIVLLFQPVSGGIAFVWLLGLYAIIFGILIAVVSLETRQELISHNQPTN